MHLTFKRKGDILPGQMFFEKDILKKEKQWALQKKNNFLNIWARQ